MTVRSTTFICKLDDALSKIKTPYVMMSDNDDFLFPSGIIEKSGMIWSVRRTMYPREADRPF